jgi:hypothetical protein
MTMEIAYELCSDLEVVRGFGVVFVRSLKVAGLAQRLCVDWGRGVNDL